MRYWLFAAVLSEEVGLYSGEPPADVPGRHANCVLNKGKQYIYIYIYIYALFDATNNGH